MKFPNKETLTVLRKTYPVGTVIELQNMNDCQAPPVGTLGKVQGVDDAGNILMHWQTGSTLSLIPGVDTFRIMKKGGTK